MKEINPTDLKKITKKFQSKRIVVLGDLMLDKYIFGEVRRISPEAPIPIVKVQKERFVPGGAANAANNISSLSANVYLFGVLGNDLAKDILIDVAKTHSINTEGVIIDGKKQTIQKIRVLGQNQQLLRVDYEDQEYLGSDEHSTILERLRGMGQIDSIIVSDYAKGTITKKLMGELTTFAKENNILLIIDPKPKHKKYYKGVSLITPNKKEAEELTGMELKTTEDIEKAGLQLIKELECSVLITTGNKGMSLFEKNKNPVHIPTVAREVFDVSGAGDTVIATLSLALSSGASLHEAAVLANYAAGVKVGKVGTAPVSLSELEQSLQSK